MINVMVVYKGQNRLDNLWDKDMHMDKGSGVNKSMRHGQFVKSGLCGCAIRYTNAYKNISDI